jgi:myosin heavy subunit
VQTWIAEKKAYLTKPVEVLSVGAAKYQLNVLSAYFEEAKAMAADRVAKMNSQAKALLDDKFEHSSTVSSREAEIEAGQKELGELSAHKKLVHEDDLSREEFKAKVRGWNEEHKSRYSKLATFISDKEAYLTRRKKSTHQLKLSCILVYWMGSSKKRKTLASIFLL